MTPGAGAAAVRAGAGTQVRAAALAVTAGVLYSLAQPPLDLGHVAWVCLVPVLAAIDGCRTWRGAALASLAFALVFSALVAGWLVGAVRLFFATSGLLAWLVALGVYVVFAGVPVAVFGAFAHGLLRRRSTTATLVGVPALYVVSEVLRTHVVCGLPWGLLGHALYRSPTLIQVADVTGLAGVSFVIAQVNTALFLALRPARSRGAALAPLAVAVAVVAAVGLYGHGRLAALADAPDAPAVRVGVLQPNQAPIYHATQVTGDRALLGQARLSQQSFGGRAADVVLWPENAVPFYVERDAHAQTQLKSLASALHAALIVGAPAMESDGARRVFNAAHLVTPEGGASGVYHKRRLVPFAEYNPFSRKAAVLTGPAAFSPGDEPSILRAAGTRFGPTICLDIIYPDVVRASVLAGAEVLVNLSNDSWLAAGGNGASAQQFAQTVFRAIENRRDVVRVATTGISAMVSATGVPHDVLLEHQAGAFIAPVHARRGLTLYTRVGDLFAATCVLGALVVVLWARRRPVTM